MSRPQTSPLPRPSTTLPSPFFRLSIQRPPQSPLFPYTTLFRSKVGGNALGRAVTDGLSSPSPRAGEGSGRRPRVRGDRKSTRLNSSHLGISYAVFCLKKKSASLTLRQHNRRLRDTVWRHVSPRA